MKILRHTERRWWVGLLGLNEGAESQQLARVSRQIKGECGGILTSLRFSSELFCFSAILSSTRLLSKRSIYELVNAINLHHPNPHHNTLSYMWWVGRRGLLRYSHFRADKLKTLIHVHFGFGLGLGHKHRANLFINGSILVLNRVKLVLDDLIFSLLDGQCFTRLDQLLELWGGRKRVRVSTKFYRDTRQSLSQQSTHHAGLRGSPRWSSRIADWVCSSSLVVSVALLAIWTMVDTAAEESERKAAWIIKTDYYAGWSLIYAPKKLCSFMHILRFSSPIPQKHPIAQPTIPPCKHNASKSRSVL